MCDATSSIPETGIQKDCASHSEFDIVEYPTTEAAQNTVFPVYRHGRGPRNGRCKALNDRDTQARMIPLACKSID